jgi:predicted component of type VI protein secretion system
MAKLVVLTEGMAGRAIELTAGKTTIGRVEDNIFQIPEPSISSHHCEVLLQGSEVKIHDLNSTNGTFINDQPVTEEAVLSPGQILRLGKVEIRLETAAAAAGLAPAPTTPVPGPAKKPIDRTVAMSGGVSLNELEQGPRQGGFDGANKAFSKKDNKVNKIFIAVVVVMMLVIAAVLVYVFNKASK